MAYKSTAATRQRLIFAAESLVAKRGIGGVSAREVAKSANLRNNCSVQYHFGSMDDLLEQVVRYRMGQLDEIRLDIIHKETNSEQRAIDLRSLMELICLPHLQLTGDDGTHTYAAFLCQYLPIHHPMGFRWMMRTSGPNFPAIRWIIQNMRSNLPGLSKDVFDRRLTSASLLFLNTLQGLSRSPSAGADKGAENWIIEDAIRQGVAVLTASTVAEPAVPSQAA